MADWDRIKAEYIAGGISTRKLAGKHGVSYGTLRHKCERERWVDAMRAQDAKKTQKIIDKTVEKTAKKAVDIIDIADELIGKLSASMESIDAGDYDRMMQAASILLKLRETKRGLTAADAREQEARIAKLQKEAEREEQTNEVQISFEGCDPAWQA